MFRKVLVTIDGSDVAREALPLAARAVGADGEIIVLEVVDTAEHIFAQTTPAGFAIEGGRLSADLINEVIDSQRAAASQHLEDAKRALEAQGVTNVSTLMMEGLPGESIVKAAHDHGVEVIVMTTHGRTGFRRAVLGSVADHVVRNGDLPVLLSRVQVD